MAQTEVLKEFLVSIGYRQDETSFKKVSLGISSITKAVITLGTVIETTALAVSVAATRWAGSLEQLYFASQRTGSSANSITALGLAARNFGASIEEANAALENLAAYRRNNFGGDTVIASLLGSLGLQSTDANGKMLDTYHLLLQLGKAYEKLRAAGQTPRANQMAQMFGTPDHMMLAMSNPDFQSGKGGVADEERRAQGLNKAAEAAHKFMIQWENFKLSVKQLLLPFEGKALAAIEKLLPKLSAFLHEFGPELVKDLAQAFGWALDNAGEFLKWLTANGPEIRRQIQEIFDGFKKGYDTVKPAFVWLKDKFFELNALTDGWLAKILAVTLALRVLGAGSIVSGIAGLGAAMAKGLGGAVLGDAALGTASTFGAAAATAFLGGVAGWEIGKWIKEKWPDNPITQSANSWIDLFTAFENNGKHMMGNGSMLDRIQRGVAEQDHVPWSRFPHGPPESSSSTTTPNVTVNNHVNVTGVSSPQETADAVTDAIGRQAADLVRTYSGVLQ